MIVRRFWISLLFLLCASCTTVKKQSGPPPGMAYLAGGVITVGDYETDDSHWGKREGFFQPFGTELEVTQSDTNSGTSRGGAFNVRVLGLRALRIVKPTPADINGATQRRCLIPLEKFLSYPVQRVIKDVHPRAGRGASWPEFPLIILAGTAVDLYYKIGNWVLVQLEPDGPDTGGWIPISYLAADARD